MSCKCDKCGEPVEPGYSDAMLQAWYRGRLEIMTVPAIYLECKCGHKTGPLVEYDYLIREGVIRT
jgi:hypothetical protein